MELIKDKVKFFISPSMHCQRLNAITVVCIPMKGQKHNEMLTLLMEKEYEWNLLNNKDFLEEQKDMVVEKMNKRFARALKDGTFTLGGNRYFIDQERADTITQHWGGMLKWPLITEEKTEATRV